MGVDAGRSVGFTAFTCFTSVATSALAGYSGKRVLGFVSVSFLAVNLWAALIPAAAIVVFRVGRRAVMASQRDKTAPQRGPRRGFRATLQFWAGWSR
ncbi:hypothetical protein [Streptomyces atroolivaceus]|uniref:hypothetical protein n=1 Tax=Streptomyces atroolivaceus TaxID=66869 RepID=UPI0037BBBA89